MEGFKLTFLVRGGRRSLRSGLEKKCQNEEFCMKRDSIRHKLIVRPYWVQRHAAGYRWLKFPDQETAELGERATGSPCRCDIEFRFRADFQIGK